MQSIIDITTSTNILLWLLLVAFVLTLYTATTNTASNNIQQHLKAIIKIIISIYGNIYDCNWFCLWKCSFITVFYFTSGNVQTGLP